MRQAYRALWLSDVHLGTGASRAEVALEKSHECGPKNQTAEYNCFAGPPVQSSPSRHSHR